MKSNISARISFISSYKVNVSDKSYKENQCTHSIFNSFFFFENRAVCEIMWKNTVESDMPQMTIERMRTSCWITKATNTHSEY